MIQALIFDFDGLILDTELPDLQSWQEAYRAYGLELPLPAWLTRVGRVGDPHAFDPHNYLEQQLGHQLDRELLRAARRRRNDQMIASQPVLPGVEAYIAEAGRLGLKLAVASSSSHNWVDGHLQRLGLWSCFDCVVCGDDVPRRKPDPAVYLAVLAALGVRSEEALAFEDSPTGMAAARAAGIFCVVVPNALTRNLTFAQPDLLLDSLADLPLADALLLTNNHRRGTIRASNRAVGRSHHVHRW